ncbi:hypothetical protein BTN33_22860 [Aeromonas veronii]|nr:hypothetical protein [Aeromonas veronii]OLF56771.1 hypothetical protein BTN33_22860 [Aeromonas veronii]
MERAQFKKTMKAQGHWRDAELTSAEPESYIRSDDQGNVTLVEPARGDWVDGEPSLPSTSMSDHTAGSNQVTQSTQEPVNVIDEHISSHLSSDDELDFVWVTQVDITALTPVPEHYSPTEGSSILFLHSNGTDLLLKKRAYSPQRLATHIKTLGGYHMRGQEPLVLAACYAGAGGHSSIAQALADSLQRPVVASPGMVHIAANNEKTTLISAYSPLPFTKFHPLPTYP